MYKKSYYKMWRQIMLLDWTMTEGQSSDKNVYLHEKNKDYA